MYQTHIVFLDTDGADKVAYFLADGIYPRWPMFALPIHEAPTAAQRHYKKAHEAMRKDVERL